jgi:hypothetical protein
MTGSRKVDLAAAPVGFIGGRHRDYIALHDDPIGLLPSSPNGVTGATHRGIPSLTGVKSIAIGWLGSQLGARKRKCPAVARRREDNP